MRKWVSFDFVNATSKCFVGNLPVRCRNRVPYFIVPHYSLDTFKACIDLIKIYLLSLKKFSVYLVVGKGPPTLSIEFSKASKEKPVKLVRLNIELSTTTCIWHKKRSYRAFAGLVRAIKNYLMRPHRWKNSPPCDPPTVYYIPTSSIVINTTGVGGSWS